MKVLVAGAGPTGLSAALELSRLGVEPEIAEKRAGPSNLSRAVGVMPESVAKLKYMGVGQAIRDEGRAFKHVRIHRNGKPILTIDTSAFAERGEMIIGLAQDRTECLMRDGLAKAGIEVQYNKEIVGIKTNEEEAEVTFANGTTETYEWVIAADGVRSTIREAMGIEFVGYDLDETWSIADVEIEDGSYDTETFSAFLLDEGKVSIIAPMERARVRVVSSTGDALASLPVKLATTEVRRTASFTIPVRQAVKYQKGRVLFAGDAAHSHSPVGGRGMNLGIDDAIAAARDVVEGTVANYHQVRHKKGQHVISLTERARKQLTSKSTLTRGIIVSVMRVVDALPFLHPAIVRNLTRL